jgi:5'-nucleotidase
MVLVLVHEGAPNTSCASVTDNANAFGRIVNGTIGNVNGIISGHTHLAYNCTVAGKPVVSSGQYGTNYNKLTFTVDTTAHTATPTGQSIVSANSVTLTDPSAISMRNDIKTIVDAARARADVLGAQELGKISGPFYRSRLADGTTENRGGESTIGNLVAEVQKWATSTPEAGAAQIAFMNPGGLRDDMVGNNAAGYPAALTYKQAAVVQPFANTLVNMKLTGAQIKKVLEQQWQRDDKGLVPTRPFLRLGTSKGFFATYDPTRAEGDRVTGMWLDGKPIDAATAYSVTVNSFLASGGDNFREFANGTSKRDTGKVDLQAMVDYMAAKAKTTPLPVDAAQHQVGVTWAGPGRTFAVGSRVSLNLTSLAMTGKADPLDGRLGVKVGSFDEGTVGVDNSTSTLPFDEVGRAKVRSKLRRHTPLGSQTLTFAGDKSGTTFGLPITVEKAQAIVKVKNKKVTLKNGRLVVRVKALGLKKFKGKVKIKVGGKKYVAKLRKGKAVFHLQPFSSTGKKKVVARFLGNKFVSRGKAVARVKVHRA